MNSKKSMAIVVAIGLCIILVIPVFLQYPLPNYWSDERPIIQEIQNIQEPSLLVEDKGCFIENKGQLGNDDILFYSEIPGGTIGFAEGKVLLWSHGAEDVVELSFPDGELVIPQGITQVSEYFNYFLGHRGTFTHLRGYENVMFENLWSGIDLVYKSTPEGTKYEFRVAPGADPSDISVRCDGHDELVVDDIDITIVKDDNAFRDVGLLVSQDNKRAIQATYLQYDQQTYGIEVGQYDHSDMLIVDPLIFSTFIGGGNDDAGYSAAVDGQGNIIVAGWSFSNNFPMLSAYNGTFGGSMDCFVAKLDPGGDLIFSTFIGGSLSDFAAGVGVDSDGEITLIASTQSPEYPTTNGAYDETHNDGYDIAITKLTAAGDALVFSTFVGGSGQDVTYGAITRQSSAGGCFTYVTGYTESADFPTVQLVTPGWNGTYVSGRDIIVFVLDRDGTDLAWSNIVGGSGDDLGMDLGIDQYGWVMVTGMTDSVDLPANDTTFEAYDSSHNGNMDCFCLGFSNTGEELGFLTYIGGDDDDKGYGLAANYNGASFITGLTWSETFPTTPNAYDRSYNGDGDAFVIKISPDGSELSFGTYVGGFFQDRGNEIMIDSSGDLIVIGRTGSEDFPTLYAYDSSHNGGIDGFILKMSYDGETILSSSYIGGLGEEYVTHGLTNCTNGNIVITGGTHSTNFPMAGNQTFDDSHNGEEDVFVMVFTSDFSHPEFSSVTRSIQSPNSLETVQVIANATDPEGVTQVALQYRVNNNTWEEVAMTRVSIGSNSWTGTIPTQVVDAVVEYRVVASDDTGNSGVSTIDSYLVVAPPPLVIDPGLIIALVSLSAAVLGIVGGLIKLRAIRLERSLKGTKAKDTPKSEE